MYVYRNVQCLTMRTFAIAIASLFASAVLAATPPGIPACAGSCIPSDILGQGVASVCSDKKLLAKLSCCVSKNCNAADQQSKHVFIHESFLTRACV